MAITTAKTGSAWLLCCLVLAASGCNTATRETTRLENAPTVFQSPSGYLSELVETSLIEDGEPVRLQIVSYTPPGDGPFPLLVFNHGSTGNGRDPGSFRIIQASPAIAHRFVDRGWMVVMPQRRGRGWSDGRYDEGFGSNRANGYSCSFGIALSGAERALEDIREAIAIVSARPNVDKSRIVIGGNSRGGILAVAYAGRHGDQVKGAINFVGGWLSRRCDPTNDVNRTLFSSGAGFPHPTLWLYGEKDRYYSVGFSRQNFQSFIDAGGKGDFLSFSVPGGSGHRLLERPMVWMPALNQYMADLGFEEFVEDSDFWGN